MATCSAIAVTFFLSIITIGIMVMWQPQNRFTTKQFDVKDHVGVAGNDITSETMANWTKACESGSGRFDLSTGNLQLGPVIFKGPCKGGKMNFNVIGIVKAKPKNAWPSNTDTWIKFQNIPSLHVFGQNGRFNGQGPDWWNSCQRAHPNTCEKNNPTALAFHGCSGLVLDQVTSINSPRNHISINACNGATISNINIQAPGDIAPNTDGIDISDTNGVHVNGGHIGTGDDCIAINAGSFNINITGLNCGPGHGISIGSLGRNHAKESAGNIHVSNATLTNTQNGVRIKTVPGGAGSANQITFKDITMINVQKPIILSQFYCPHVDPKNCPDERQMVQINNVTFNNIHGTSTTKDAINIHCSKYSNGCAGITLQNINIQPASRSLKVESTCLNTNVGLISPVIPGVKCVQNVSLIEMLGDDNYEKAGQQALIATS